MSTGELGGIITCMSLILKFTGSGISYSQSIINSIVIVVILASMVAMILLRTLHRDISRYNSLNDEDGAQEEFGWKMVHADVFRPPNHRMILSVLLGNGAQIFCMAGVTLIFAVLGFLSPSSRGSLVTMALVFYMLFSVISGYVSGLMYKSLQGEHWRRNVLLTAFLVPGIIFAILLTLNFILIARQSSSAVPFGTLLALMAMWFLISIPLCIVGAYFGFRHPGYENPCKTNQIPRQIPPQVFASNLAILSWNSLYVTLGRNSAIRRNLH
jgi:transmembrane 9 superfamily member 2/4